MRSGQHLRGVEDKDYWQMNATEAVSEMGKIVVGIFGNSENIISMQLVKEHHGQLGALLFRFHENKNLQLSSETARELINELFQLLIQHIAVESQLLKDRCKHSGDFEIHTLHLTDMLSNLSEFNFELLAQSDKTVAFILPQIRSLIDEHDNYHSQSASMNC